jgi:hypothetical protein
MTENLKKKCDILLAAMLGKDNIEGWWQSRNKAFNMMTAQEQLDIDPEVVYNYLMKQALR